MMAYLTRRENFAEGSPPPKPYNELQFKENADILLQGIYGTTSKDFFIDAIQKELDKGVEKGIITMEEGLEFIKDRKKYYDDYLKEQSKTTEGFLSLPGAEERTEFKNGSNEALKKINEAGAQRVTDKVERFKELVKLDKTPNEAKKIVIEEFDLQRGKSTGTPKWMTRGKSELIEEGVKFTESKRGPEPTGDQILL